MMGFCERPDARHISAVLGREAGPAAGIVLHDFYVPAGGDVPDRDVNPKFAHKLDFLAELRAWADGGSPARRFLVGDLNVAPLEHDVWSHKQLLDVVSHTPAETEALETLRGEAGWIDAAATLTPGAREDLHVVELPLAELGSSPTRGGASTTPGSRPDLAGTVRGRHRLARDPRLGAPLRPRAGDAGTRALRGTEAPPRALAGITNP